MIPLPNTPLVEAGLAIAPLAFLVGIRSFRWTLTAQEARKRAATLRCVCGHIFLKHGHDHCYGSLAYTAGNGMCPCPIFEPDQFWDVMRYFHLRLRTGRREIA